MNSIAPRLLLSVFIASLLGCASSPGAPPVSARGCASSIADHCASHPCETYDQAVARAHALKADPPTAYPWAYRIGTCGSLRFISVQEGMGVVTDYFDASGAVVSKAGVADAEVCAGEFGWTAGGRPSCHEQVLEHAGGSPR